MNFHLKDDLGAEFIAVEANWCITYLTN